MLETTLLSPTLGVILLRLVRVLDAYPTGLSEPSSILCSRSAPIPGIIMLMHHMPELVGASGRSAQSRQSDVSIVSFLEAQKAFLFCSPLPGGVAVGKGLSGWSTG